MPSATVNHNKATGKYLQRYLIIFFCVDELHSLGYYFVVCFQCKWRLCPGSLGPGAAPGLRTERTASASHRL